MIIPAFIITIDTEGDNLWESYYYASTKNAQFLQRFQNLCEKYHFKLVYLTNYEMAINNNFIDFARDAIVRGCAEIGMHIHAWNSPPIYNLTGNDWYYKPYLIEYPKSVIREKIIFITKLLEETFQIKMLSHRAGRWAFNEFYASILLELGYQIDCSVTPKVNWRTSLGAPHGNGGSDYRYFPSSSYFIDLQNISRSKLSTLLEVPITIHYKYPIFINYLNKFCNKLQKKQYNPSVCWFRPNSLTNATYLCQIANMSFKKGYDYIEFMIHSSELMPGGSPTFKSKDDIEKLYRNLEKLFDWLNNRVISMTLTQYYQYRIKQLGIES